MKVAVVSSGFEARHWRLQPHRSLLEMGRQLMLRGHDVVLVSDCRPGEQADGVLEGLPVLRVPDVNVYRTRPNPALLTALSNVGPDLLLWHLSLNSFFHQSFAHPYASRTIGVVTSPIYSALDALRLGLDRRKLSSNPELVASHLAGSLLPRALLRRGLSMRGLIALSDTTRRFLIARGTPADRVWTVPPGIDRAWLDARITPAERAALRRELGYEPGHFVVAYFGSPAPVRGLHTTLRALARVAPTRPNIRLMVLSRRHSNEWEQQAAILDRLISVDELRGRVQVIDGFLQQPELIRYLLASDAVCLPFELVPSDMPLSILEAMALEKGVIGTTVACIPELLDAGRGFLVPPSSPRALADELATLAVDPGRAEQRGRVARVYVSRERTWDDMGRALEEAVVRSSDAVRAR